MDKELIARLAQQAGIHDSYNDQVSPEALDRFAVLIAEECAKLVDDQDFTLDVAQEDLARAIREKFKP